ncbi:MAG TPA: hypothetical protein VG435_08925 [Acidimicrobiales bacterium]|jgi:hypothetical protein|nr:hypothetical protein [Acidimicrobiales bacterium]
MNDDGGGGGRRRRVAWLALLLLTVAMAVGTGPAWASTPHAVAAGCVAGAGSSATSTSPASTAAGAQSAAGNSTDGSSALASPAPGRSSSGAGLAFTGTNIMALIVVAGLLLGAGILLVVSGRRRPSGPESLGCAVAGVVVARLFLPVTGMVAVPNASCTPPVATPESPFSILLPIAAVVVFLAVYRRARRAGRPPSATGR